MMGLKRLYLFLPAAFAFVGAGTAVQAVPAIGLLANGSLFSFDTATPGTNTTIGTVTGLQGSEIVYGLDYRPANGALYALGSTGRLYTVNTVTGAATLASTLSTGLSGSGFDIAFNPVPDRLRIVSNSGQNLRVNVDTGVVTVDTSLAFAAGDPNFGTAPSVVAVGYTNQFAGAATTTLFDINGVPAVLATQNPPNNGTLNTVGATNGSLISLDIASDSGIAYGASGSSFYTVNLATGSASLVGAFAASTVTDFTLLPVAEPLSAALFGLGLTGLAVARRRRSPPAG